MEQTSKLSAYTLTTNSLTELFKKYHQSETRVSRIMNDIFRHFRTQYNNHPELSKQIKFIFEHEICFSLPLIHTIRKSQDGTIKFLIQFNDGKTVESVLLNFHNKHTLCISSQVGCAMACSFCFTGKQGLSRQLSTFEIVGQYLAVVKWIKENNHSALAVKNIVFMGQGEPLHNIDNLSQAIQIFTDARGLGLSAKNITVSTSGYLPGLQKIQKLAGVNLALSLHSTINEIRTQLIPINKNYPLEKLFPVLDTIPLAKKQLIEFEYLLIKDLNDNELEIAGLVKLLKNRAHMLNIIPFNPFPGSAYQRPSPQDCIAFAKQLAVKGLRVSIRKTKGTDVLAACGQLNTKIH